MAPIGNAVYATLLMNDAYLPGAMVLGHSLRDKGSKAKLVVLVVIDKLAATTISDLKTVYDEIVPVQQISNRAPANLYLMNRPDLISTFTKIELWKQTQYDRIVYIDADVVALRAPNELLTMPTDFAAVPDIGWPDCFNSGVMVLNPNLGDYYALLALAERGISFDGADQGLLNMHFTEWERLSFKYNCTPSGNYQYAPAYRHFQSSINLVHFIGRDKPWNLGRTTQHASGVYGELLGRWWAIYDKHYHSRETVYVQGQYEIKPKKVQDYVSGEQTLYLPASQAPPPQSHQPASSNQSYRPGHVHQNYHSDSPATHIQPPAEHASSSGAEESMRDQPSVEDQIQHRDYAPTSTIEQRRWSAPHTEWEPARAPPPTNSKPEASNFPSQIYDFSDDTKLFQPPASYPEAPKDMWYQVPNKAEPPPKPRAIFPWEEHAPKPTRVFAEPKFPSPPPELADPEPVVEKSPGPTEPETPEPERKESVDEAQPEPYVSPWETFNQRTNAWDDMPEITRYVQALQPPKRGKIQVLHHTPSSSTGALGELGSPTGETNRRPSLKLTDFPTEYERPSLPVTPAPIRRPTFWGEEKDMSGELPIAEGVPKQDEWVRRFSSYPKPAFRARVREIDGTLVVDCQHCGEQNPIAKLEELQQRQGELLLPNENPKLLKDPPKRDLPESASREAVEAAVEKATSPSSTRPLKPILKEPRFELSSETLPEPADTDTNTMNNTFVEPEEEISPLETRESTSNTSTPRPTAAA